MKVVSDRFGKTAVAATASALVLTLAACGSGRTDDGDSGDSGDGLIIGTTDKVVSLDPAGAYDNGSLTMLTQLYQWLVTVEPGGTELQMDAAEECDWKEPTIYSCTLRDGLTFSNGHELTSEDVKFSFDRMVAINDPNGPASLLGNLESVAAPDEKTIDFTVSVPTDNTFPYVLAGFAGAIVDSEVFPADSLIQDESTVIGSGPYSLKSYQKGEIAEFAVNDSYKGGHDKPVNSGVIVKTYAKAENLKLDVADGAIDIAWRSLSAQDIGDLKDNDDVKVLEGAGGEIRYMVFNLNTMPGDNIDQKRAVRRAMAFSIDRQSIADKVYQGTYDPLYSMMPTEVEGGAEPFKDEFGESPDKEKAAAELAAAGMTTPVPLKIQYNPDHYGSNSDQEYNEVKTQLEETGLFTVELQSTEWVTYNSERVQDTYPIYQLGWFPDFPDPDNYLSPFFAEGNFVQSHYCDEGAADRPCDQDGVLPLLSEQVSAQGDERVKLLEQIQEQTTTGTMPYLPLLVGKQVAVTGPDVSGVEDTLDPSYLFRMWLMKKG